PERQKKKNNQARKADVTTTVIIQKVTEDEKVSTVKELVSERLNIPANQQRLLYKGKALADEHRLSDYSIGPEAKLNLVIRPVGERTGASGTAASSSSSSSSCSSGSSSSSTHGGVWQTVSTILARHFSPADAAKVHEQLIKDYERSLRQLSLDDIERLAGRLLHPDGEGMDTSYMD
uniref:Ubiquitin-like domain-containing protein n=1 Tax=Mastacembelus armatus TaxID=205130 RepID=A0A3Q3LL24_9TELE